MGASGLTEVANPSELFIAERATKTTGSVVVCTMEGNRPLLVEIQALTTPSVYGTPQRVATGPARLPAVDLCVMALIAPAVRFGAAVQVVPGLEREGFSRDPLPCALDDLVGQTDPAAP